MKKRCVIVDDEPLARKLIVRYVQKIEELELIGECKNIIQLHDILDSQHVDLIFLDIEMPLIKGTDFLRSFRDSAKVIFTTAHRRYAVEAFDLNVVDYLLKPITFSRFYDGIVRFYNALGNDSSPSPKLSKFLEISINRRMVNINCDDILYIESMKDYIIIYTNENHYKTKKTLSSVESMLIEDFTRIHRSFIVNNCKIESVSNKEIVLNNGWILPVGKKYRHKISIR